MRAVFVSWVLLTGCAIVPRPLPSASAAPGPLEKVAALHGAAGPWAVLGYRMGDYALKTLDVPEGSFDLEVVHHSPLRVQEACIADGAAAATGASLGKLNLALKPVTEEGLFTEFRVRSSGRTLRLRPTAAFRRRFTDVPRETREAAGEAVLALAEGEAFEPAP